MQTKFRHFKKVRLNRTKDIKVNKFLMTCPIGSKVSKHHTFGTFVISFKGVSDAKIPINGDVLRSALLNSKQLLATELGLDIRDMNEEYVDVNPETEVPKPIPNPDRKKREGVQIIDLDFVSDKSNRDKELKAMKVEELREILKENDFPYTGKVKEEMIKDIIKYDLV